MLAAQQNRETLGGNAGCSGIRRDAPNLLSLDGRERVDGLLLLQPPSRVPKFPEHAMFLGVLIGPRLICPSDTKVDVSCDNDSNPGRPRIRFVTRGVPRNSRQLS